jgi:uncharacterized protein YbgA (DUF1722 family)
MKINHHVKGYRNADIESGTEQAFNSVVNDYRFIVHMRNAVLCEFNTHTLCYGGVHLSCVQPDA